MSGIGLNELGYDEKLYILAFDHRGSFEKMVGGGPDEGRRREAADLGGLPAGRRRRARRRTSPGILVDAQYGADVAREAKAGGYKLAMPVEKSGQKEFDFEYGDAVRREDRGVRPDFSKVLVRYNPEGDAEMNERQSAKLLPPLRVAARAPPQVPLRAAGAGRGGAARERRRQRRPLRHRASRRS